MKRYTFLLALWLFGTSQAAAHVDDLSDTVAGKILEQLQIQQKSESLLTTSKNTNIPPIEYEFVQEMDRPDDLYKLYNLRVKPLEAPTPAIMIIKKVDGTLIEQQIYVTSSGIIQKTEQQSLTWAASTGYGESLEMLILPTLENGEIIKNAKPLGKAEFIPFPLVAEDKKGHKMELVVVGKYGENFMLTLSGFAPKEKLFFESLSSGEMLSAPISVDEKGTITLSLAPAVIGKTEGPLTLTIKSDRMQPLVINHYWGKIAYTTAKGYPALAKRFKGK